VSKYRIDAGNVFKWDKEQKFYLFYGSLLGRTFRKFLKDTKEEEKWEEISEREKAALEYPRIEEEEEGAQK